MSEKSIFSADFYNLLKDNLKKNEENLSKLADSYGELKISFTALKTNLDNLVLNNNNKFKDITSAQQEIEQDVKTLKANSYEARTQLKELLTNEINLVSKRVEELERDKIIKTRMGKFINSPVGMKLLTVFFGVAIVVTGFEFYKVDSPQQKKYIESLENQNKLLQADMSKYQNKEPT